MNGSIGIEVQVDLQDIAYEAKWLNLSDAVDLVVSIDEARADLEFTKAMYNYFRQALLEEGALKKDERTERIRRAVAEIQGLLTEETVEEEPKLRKFVDCQGDARWEVDE